jgi:hypothetical protein
MTDKPKCRRCGITTQIVRTMRDGIGEFSCVNGRECAERMVIQRDAARAEGRAEAFREVAELADVVRFALKDVDEQDNWDEQAREWFAKAKDALQRYTTLAKEERRG